MKNVFSCTWIIIMVNKPYKTYLITYGCIWFEFKDVVKWVSSTFIFVNIILHQKTIGIAVFGIHRLWQEHRTDIFNADAIFRLKIEIALKFPSCKQRWIKINKYVAIKVCIYLNSKYSCILTLAHFLAYSYWFS